MLQRSLGGVEIVIGIRFDPGDGLFQEVAQAHLPRGGTDDDVKGRQMLPSCELTWLGKINIFNGKLTMNGHFQ